MQYTREEFAQMMFKDIVSRMENAGGSTKEERMEVLKFAATICFEAADAFYEVEREQRRVYDDLPF